MPLSFGEFPNGFADEIQQQGLVTATQKLNRKQIRDLNKEAIANCINELKK